MLVVDVVGVLVEVLACAVDELVPDVPDKLKRSEMFEDDELDVEPENNDPRVCVTACSAARTSCAA